MANAFWVTGPNQGRIGPAEDAAENAVTVKTLYSGISRGTESLVFSNQVPE